MYEKDNMTKRRQWNFSCSHVSDGALAGLPRPCQGSHSWSRRAYLERPLRQPLLNRLTAEDHICTGVGTKPGEQSKERISQQQLRVASPRQRESSADDN
eukprot:6175412-Pleurochrysis_carterae.AAC.3